MVFEISQNDLMKEIPFIKRARGFRLYTQNGKRLLDLWQQGGRAILGHNAKGVLRELKNNAERGLIANFPNAEEKRLYKALSKIFPERQCRIYADRYSFYQTLKSQNIKEENISVWRPFINDSDPFFISEAEKSVILFPILPYILAPLVLVLPVAISDFPPSDTFSPAILAATTKSVYGLIMEKESRGKMQYPKIESLFTQNHWQRNGIYITSKKVLDKKAYTDLFLNFLDKGFLLPPSNDLPIILPETMSLGEEAKLAELLRKN